MKTHILRKIRIILAAILFTGITLMFMDFTGALHKWLGWMAKIQFLPALLAVNTVIIAGLLLLTVLFGRIYCSVICPLGIMQDIISWINGRLKKKNKFRFRYKKEKKWLRLGILAIFVAALALGSHSLAMIIAPYSAYGRIASNLFAPIYQWGNNLLAWAAERIGSYAFYSTEVWIRSLPTFIIAAASFTLLFIIAWKGGRAYCNSVCPVGTILGFFAKRSVFAPVIDTDRCKGCGLCGRKCKSSCIDMDNHAIDYSRCVACMDCLDTCKEGAIKYTYRYKSQSQPNQGRRTFLISSLMLSGGIAAKAGRRELGFKENNIREGKTPLVPAGSLSVKNFTDHCTSCQLCISACPEKVLKPSDSISRLMQPEMVFERGYCSIECNECSTVCPAGAIKPIGLEEKSSIQIGHAVINHDLCVVNTDNVKCLGCSRNCPVGAIRLVYKNPDDENSLLIPTVNEERCIGCGACEHYCPARPIKAIHVEGHQVHKMI